MNLHIATAAEGNTAVEAHAAADYITTHATNPTDHALLLEAVGLTGYWGNTTRRNHGSESYPEWRPGLLDGETR